MWPGRPPACGEDFLGAAADLGGRGQEHGRIEVSLDRPARADPPPGLVQADAPVDADDVAARLRQRRQQGRVAGGEVDHAARRAVSPSITRRVCGST